MSKMSFIDAVHATRARIVTKDPPVLVAGFVRDLMHEIGTGPAAIFCLLSSDPRSQAINKAGGVGCTVMSEAATV